MLLGGQRAGTRAGARKAGKLRIDSVGPVDAHTIKWRAQRPVHWRLSL